jgi:hypothetical protein
MARRFSKQLISLALAGLTAASAVACSSPPEQQMLRQYFMASRSRDNVTLGNIATVAFSPTEQGVVESFNIVSTAPDDVKQLRVRELAEALKATQAELDAFSTRKREYQDSNIEAIGRVIKAEQTGTALRGKDAEIQKEWTTWRDEEGELSKKVNDARQAVSMERAIADVSLAGRNIDLTQADATLTTRAVTITASVRPPQGDSAEREMVVTLQKAATTGTPPVEGKWIITSVK